MKRSVLYLLLLPFVLLSCADRRYELESTADLTVTYRAEFAGEQLELYKNYDYGAFPVQFTIFTQYVSDLRLLRTDGSEVLLSDVEFLDFTNGPTNLTPTPSFTFSDIPVGDYKGLRIGIGVRSDLNAKNPAEFNDSHPLSREEQYWQGWQSYIFTKIQGFADVDNGPQPDLSVFYHTGSDAVYQELTFQQPIRVAAGAAPVEIAFDLKELFTQDDGTLYDIQAHPTTAHDPSNIAVAQFIMNNYPEATTVRQ